MAHRIAVPYHTVISNEEKDYIPCDIVAHSRRSRSQVDLGRELLNVFTELHGMQKRSSDENSIRVSVRLSVSNA